MIEKLLEAIFGRLWDAFTEHPYDALALAGVPALVVFFIVSEIGAPWSYSGGREITAVSLRSELPATSTSSSGGLILLLEPHSSDFRIDWTDGTAARLVLSLDSAASEVNKGRLLLDADGMELQGPLLGLSSPFLVYAEGVAADELSGIDGKTMQLADLEPYSRFSISVALSGLFAVLFGCGLSTSSLLQNEAADQTARGESH